MNLPQIVILLLLHIVSYSPPKDLASSLAVEWESQGLHQQPALSVRRARSMDEDVATGHQLRRIHLHKTVSMIQQDITL